MDPSVSSGEDVITQIVGRLEGRFSTQKILAEKHDSTALQENDVLFDGVHTSLRAVSFHVNRYIIMGIDASLSSNKKQVFGSVNYSENAEVKVSSFQFEAGEKITSLTVYYNFAGQMIEAEGTEDESSQTTYTKRHTIAEILYEFVIMFFSSMNHKDHWFSNSSHSAVRCCGVAFVTNRRRRFKVMAWNRFGFCHSCKVELGTGQCCGIKATAGSPFISYLGFLFLTDNAAAVSTDRSITIPLIGDSSPVTPQNVISTASNVVSRARPIVQRVWPYVRGIARRILPARVTEFFGVVIGILLQFLLPIADILTDLGAAYTYYDEGYEELAYAIAAFTILPHFVSSLALISDIILGSEELLEYPARLIRFYQSNFAGWRPLSNFLKILTAPLLTILLIIWFIQSIFVNAWLIIRRLLGASSPQQTTRQTTNETVEQTTTETVEQTTRETAEETQSREIEAQNVTEEGWSKVVFRGLLFESFPELLTQGVALLNMYRTGDAVEKAAIFASIGISALMLLRQSYVFGGFMRRIESTFFSTAKILIWGVFNRIPIFNLFNNTVRDLVVRFNDSRVFMELWRPLCQLMTNNTSVKAVTLFLRQRVEWFDMAMDFLEALQRNERLIMDTMNITMEANEELDSTSVEKLKQRLCELVSSGKVKQIVSVFDEKIDLGILQEHIKHTTKDSVIDRDVKWTWKYKDEDKTKIEYCLQKST